VSEFDAATLAAATAATQLRLWRAVEAQHVVATNALVDTLAEQALLEQILEAAKPPAPRRRALHWLLFTPFRYPPLPYGSRFRGPTDAGVWYGADEIRTACAELGYWRWRFLRASPSLAALPARAQTVFEAHIVAGTVDLRAPPFVAQRTRWTAPNDYSGTQRLARAARGAGVDLIRYESVRDPERGGCGAVLTPNAFSTTTPLTMQTWLLAVDRQRVSWASTSALEEKRLEFDAHEWH
jgi:hypothetical protein